MSTDLGVEETTGHELKNDEPDAAGEQLVTTSVEDADTNVFRVLGAQARTRSIAQLWVAALGGAGDAALLWWRHPMLGWLAAGCAAAAAYGAWGLLDRAIETKRAGQTGPSETLGLEGLRDFVAIAGTAAALWAALSFMAVALGNWNH